MADVLNLIESLAARLAIPGHGAPFDDVPAALQVARQRLAGFRADPERHARHAMKALLKFHLLAEQHQSWAQLSAFLHRGSLYARVWQRLGRPNGSMDAFGESLVRELVASGVLALRDGLVYNH